MRLRAFEIRNFKAIAFLHLAWDDLLVLIGENNSGKSSVLAALTCFLGGSGIKCGSNIPKLGSNIPSLGMKCPPRCYLECTVAAIP